MSVALKSSQLTVRPSETRGFTSRLGDSPSRTGGLAGQKNANKNEANILDQTRLANWPCQKEICFLYNQGSPGNPKWQMGPFCLSGSQLKTHDSL